MSEKKFLEDEFEIGFEKSYTNNNTTTKSTNNKSTNNKNTNAEHTSKKLNLPTNIKFNKNIIIKSLLAIIIFLSLYISVYLVLMIIPTNTETTNTNNTETTSNINSSDTVLTNTTIPINLYEPQFKILRERSTNYEVIAYIDIPNTNISYPVPQTGNNTFYLDNNLHMQQDIDGTIFMDSTNNLYPLDLNTIIYGQITKSDTLFSELMNYNDPAYAADHRYVTLYTPYEVCVYELISIYDENNDYSYLQTQFTSEDEFISFINTSKSKSKYSIDNPFTLGTYSSLLTLVAKDYNNNKLVVTFQKISNEDMYNLYWE